MIEDLLARSADIRTIEAFKHWTRKSIRPAFPHEALACGYGRVSAHGAQMDGAVLVDYDAHNLNGIRNRAGGYDAPTLRRWFSTREPQLFDPGIPWPDTPREFLDHLRRAGLKNAAVHGVYDETSCLVSYFAFFGIPGPLHERHAQSLRALVPLMHRVLFRSIGTSRDGNPRSPTLSLLTPREWEVLQLVAEGRSNKDVARYLRLSEITVKFHMTNMLRKTRLARRAQLVREYLHRGGSAQQEYGLRVY